MSHLIQTRRGVETLQRMFSTLLNLSAEPLDGPADREVSEALRLLYSALDRLDDREGPLREDGPIYFPIADVDVRDFPTSESCRARELLRDRPHLDESVREQLNSPRMLVAPDDCYHQAVLTESQYFSALKRAQPFEITPVASRVN